MISDYYKTYGTEQVELLLPHVSAPAPEPFEATLRSRLYDIMEEWEARADEMTHPALQKTLRDMIDQIDDTMHPAEDV
jgi:hypothetical protein